MRKILIIFTAIFLFAPPARSQEGSGNELLQDCRTAARISNLRGDQAFADNLRAQGNCYSYIRGVHEGIGATVALADIPDIFCIPNQVRMGQIHDTIIQYLERNPQRRHLPAALLIIQALRNAFPCGTRR